jgi:AraC-like DNA-binding protein
MPRTELSAARRTVDVLASVLEVTGLTGRVYCASVAPAPWGLRIDAGSSITFHVVTQGTCWLAAGGAPVRLVRGDVAMLPHASGHCLYDAPASRRASLPEWRAAEEERRRAAQDVPADRVTRLICGAFRFETEGPHPVLRLLPEVVHIPSRQAETNRDLQGTLAALARELESGDVGSATVVSRLLDVLFIQIVRAWLDTRPEGQSGWLGATRDRTIGRALALLHASPAEDWSIESLAEAVGMSRAPLARRFTEQVGQPPLAYLTDLRMQIAARLLRHADTPLCEVARAVGYTSEFAFNRAFKRLRGVPPGQFRREKVARAA